ncbi:MAG: hypothetical protein HY069_01255 [Chlamydiia bacterium]|nr:hypothetical protein [Chlamydiia bacterium]
MQKRSFLLLEILIALSLIGICIVPLVSRPLELLQAENKILWEMEGERLADWTYSEIQIQLFKNAIPWEKLPTKEKKKVDFSLPDIIANIPGKERRIKRHFTLEYDLGRDVEAQSYRLFKVQIHFTPELNKKKGYEYQVIVRKIVEQINPKEA